MKIYDLAFYNGLGSYPAEIYQSEFSQMIGSSTSNAIYSYRGYDITNQFYSIDNTDLYLLFFGKKILNNNVIFGDPVHYYVTPFLGARYKIESGGVSIIISLPVTNISGQNSFNQITYNEVFLNSDLPDEAGNIETGINAIRIRQDVNNVGNWYGAFPCVIFQSDSITPEIGFNHANLGQTNIVIKDFDIIPDFDLPDRYYYLITTQKVYTTDTLPNPVPIEIPLPVANFVNLTCIASYQGNNTTYRDSIIVGGFDSDAAEYRLLYFDTVTGNIWQYKTVGNGGEYKINRAYYFQFVDSLPGTTPGYWGIATDKGVFALGYDTLDNIETINDTNVSTDVQIIRFSTASTEYYATWSSNVGYFVKIPVGTTYAYQESKSFNCIGGYYSSANQIFYTMAGGNDFAYYTGVTITTGSHTTFLINDSDIFWNDIKYIGSHLSLHIGLGATSGNGITELLFTIPPSADQLGTILYLTYTFAFADLVKEDTYIYYGLLQLTGCGSADGAAAIFKLDYQNNLFEVGTIEGNVTTNKLWIADNFFILNNTQDTNSLYYKSLLNLDLAELTGSQEELVGEDAGIFNTTEAGDVVDVIIDRSMFYIVGTRAIEVWQNNGASGFPYRKQPYGTAKYHNFPQGLSSNVDNISRFTPFQGGYVIATLDNSQNKLDLLRIQDGASKPINYNKNGWLQIVNNYLSTSIIDDIQITTFKFYSEDYLAITFIDDNNIALGNAIINQKGNVFYITESENFYQYIQTVAQTGIIGIIGTTAITSRFYDYIHTTLPVDVSFSYQVTSQLFRPMSSQVLINRIIIQYSYNYDNNTNILPTSQYEIAYSTDGRPGTFLTFERNFLNNERQIVVQINRQMPSFVLRLSTNIPIVILNAVMSYEEAGEK